MFTSGIIKGLSMDVDLPEGENLWDCDNTPDAFITRLLWHVNITAIGDTLTKDIPIEDVQPGDLFYLREFLISYDPSDKMIGLANPAHLRIELDKPLIAERVTDDYVYTTCDRRIQRFLVAPLAE